MRQSQNTLRPRDAVNDGSALAVSSDLLLYGAIR